MSIIVKNLVKTYNNKKVLNNISFEIKPGEIIGLLGPNGAGKSTIMKILSCYLKQDSGEIEINKYNNLTDNLNIKKILGYLPEKNPLYKYMYVTEYLNYIAKIHKIPNRREKIKETLILLKINNESNKKIESLSKGYKQRVGIAQTILHNPKILLLDEPFSGLDPNQLIEIRKIFKNNSENRITILSTHILQEVEKTCNRCIIINKGAIMKDIKIKSKKDNLESIFKKLNK